MGRGLTDVYVKSLNPQRGTIYGTGKGQMRPHYTRGRVLIKRTKDEERVSMRDGRGTNIGRRRFFFGRPSWGCMEYIPSGTPRPLICKFLFVFIKGCIVDVMRILDRCFSVCYNGHIKKDNLKRNGTKII